MLHTMAANTVAPFVMVGWLDPISPLYLPISPFSVGALFWVGVLCGWLLRLQVARVRARVRVRVRAYGSG